MIIDSLASVVTGEPLPVVPAAGQQHMTDVVVAGTAHTYEVRCDVHPHEGPSIEAADDLEAVLRELGTLADFDGLGARLEGASAHPAPRYRGRGRVRGRTSDGTPDRRPRRPRVSATAAEQTGPITLVELQHMPVDRLAGVGPKKLTGLRGIGITSLYDLLTHYPRRYVDRTREARIVDLVAGEEALVLGQVRSVSSAPGPQRPADRHRRPP